MDATRLTLRSESDVGVEPFEWQPVDRIDTKNNWDSVDFDIDFVAFRAHGSVIFSSSHVSSLLASPSCNIFARSTLAYVRCSFCSAVLVFASVGDYQIGVPVTREQ